MEKSLQEKLSTVRGVASDVDGTLRVSGSFDVPSPRITKAFEEWRKIRGKGKFHDLVVTGSQWIKTDYLVRHLGLTGPQVTSGGAEIVDAGSGKLLRNYAINHDVALSISREFKQQAKDVGGALWVQDTGEDFDPLSKEYTPRNPYVIVLDSVPEEFADEVLNLLKSNSDVAAHKVIPKPPNEHLSAIHITHPFATKEHAMREVANMVGIDPQLFLGIGDGPNDFPLLNVCGVKAAVRKSDNSVSKELAQVADFVVPNMKNDGAAIAIERVISAYQKK